MDKKKEKNKREAFRGVERVFRVKVRRSEGVFVNLVKIDIR